MRGIIFWILFELISLLWVAAEDDWMQAALNAHNTYRANHGAAPVRIDNNLNNIARQQAQLMASYNRIILDTKGLYGELAERASATNDLSRVVELSIRSWYEGIKWYDFESPGNYSPTSNIGDLDVRSFAQIVWNKTYAVGFGIATHEGKLRNNSWTYFTTYYKEPLSGYPADYRLGVGKPIVKLDPMFERISTAGKSIQDVAIEAHNKYRSFHQAQLLKMDDEMCTMSKKWAIALAAEKNYNPRKSPPELRLDSGQNIFGQTINFYSCDEENLGTQMEKAVDYWYKSVINYEFNTPGFEHNPSANEFTQLVWKSAQKLGIGYARSPYGMTLCVIVVNYWPEIGNQTTDYANNVLPEIKILDTDIWKIKHDNIILTPKPIVTATTSNPDHEKSANFNSKTESTAWHHLKFNESSKNVESRKDSVSKSNPNESNYPIPSGSSKLNDISFLLCTFCFLKMSFNTFPLY